MKILPNLLLISSLLQCIGLENPKFHILNLIGIVFKLGQFLGSESHENLIGAKVNGPGPTGLPLQAAVNLPLFDPEHGFPQLAELNK